MMLIIFTFFIQPTPEVLSAKKNIPTLEDVRYDLYFYIFNFITCIVMQVLDESTWLNNLVFVLLKIK